MQEIKRLIGGKLRVHESRLDGTYSVSDTNTKLIEHLFKDGVQRFPAMIFRGKPDECTKSNQIDPSDRDSMLASSGEFTIVETPGVSATTFLIASVILSVASAAYAFYVASQISTDSADVSTSNRTISGRQNSARPLERIEDRAGKQLIYPTLIQKPYNKFESKREVEISLMCVGIGEYDIDEDDVKDGDTAVSIISSEAACFYAPDTMPGDSDDAFLTIGDEFDEEIKTVYQSSEVSGGEVLPTTSDVKTIIDEGDLTLSTVSSDTVDAVDGCRLTELNGTNQYYALGSSVDISGASVDITIRFAIHSAGIHPLIGRYYSSSPGSDIDDGTLVVTYNSSTSQNIKFANGLEIDTSVIQLDTVYEINVWSNGSVGFLTLVGYEYDNVIYQIPGTWSSPIAIDFFGATSFDETDTTLTYANATIFDVYWEDTLGFTFYQDWLGSTSIENTEGDVSLTAVNIDSSDNTLFWAPNPDDVQLMASISAGNLIYVDSTTTLTVESAGSSIISGETFGKLTLSDEGLDFGDYLEQYLLATINIDAEYYDSDAEETVGVTLTGSYMIVSITEDELILASPAFDSVTDVDSDWQEVIDGNIDSNNVNDDAFVRPTDTTEAKYIGPYFLGGDDRDSFFANITAESGLIKSSGGSISVTIGAQYARSDSVGNRTGSWVNADSVTLSGQTYNRIGVTLEQETDFTGPILVRFIRSSSTSTDGNDDVTLDALYGAAPVDVDDFGNITTVQTRTVAKGRATQVSERNFNLIAERKIPKIQSDGTLGDENEATSRFIDYYAYACTDSKIGRQDSSDVDYQELYDQYTEIVDYFDDTDAAEFCYTFDSDQTSFQDHADQICAAAFSIPIRTGSMLSSKFEQPGDPRTIFTHRNKIPGQQTITRSFNTDDNIDGIEFQWINPDDDDETATIYIPSDYSATKPEKIESVGVRNYAQAYWLAHRRYNKIINQRISIDDTLTAEAQLLGELDIVGITNDTNAPYYAGEVTVIDGLTLYLNQPVAFESDTDYSISLRNRDGSVELISCTEGPTSMSVTLASAPTETPYTDIDQNRTVFTMQEDSNIDADYYVISSVDRTSATEIAVAGYNYTSAFYDNDTDTPNYDDDTANPY